MSSLSRRLTSLLLCAGLGLVAGEPSSKPILRLETGMHLGGILSISSDASARLALTASDDKTARLWDRATGELLRTLRPPIGTGGEGRLYGGALSPDGRLAALGGYTGYEWDQSISIYLFDTTTGQCSRRITGIPSIILRLAFTRDGSRLVACLAEKGFRVFNLADGQELARDEAFDGAVAYCDFDGAGRLAVSCADGQIRLYDPQGRLLAKAQNPGGLKPNGIRFSPDGSRLAVGDREHVKVQVLSVPSLQALYVADIEGSGGNWGNGTIVAWSHDGETLYAAGGYGGAIDRPVRSWSEGGRGSAKDKDVGAKSTIMDLDPVGMLWGSSESAWGRIDRNDARKGSIAIFRGADLGLDPTGTRVSFPYAPYGPSFTFELAGRRLGPGRAEGLASDRGSSLPVKYYMGTKTFMLDDHPLLIPAFDQYHNISISADKARILFATSYGLRCYDPQGRQLWECQEPAAAWSVNISGNGALAVAACEDGTIRWHRMSDGQELLTLFPHADQKRWVLWTPSGYYDCSPGAEDLIGWHLNRGRDQAADFFPASRFRATYFRPDIISKVLETLDEGVAIAAANRESGNRAQAAAVEALVPPVVKILSPEFGARVSQGTVTVRASVRQPKGLAIDSVWAAVDGRRADLRGLRPQQDQGGERVYTLEVPIPAQDCIVSVFAQSGSAVSEASSVRLAWVSPRVEAPTQNTGPTQPFVIQPKLYVLAVGVGAYQNPDFKLDYPAKDARDFAAALEIQKTRLYREVEVRLLTDAGATRDAVLEGLEWLERQTTAKDVAVLFLAGHGMNDPNGSYFFLPWNADPERVRSTMVPSSEFQDVLSKLPGKVLLFLDSCHSGNVVKVKLRGATDPNRFINELSSAESGVVVFSASTGRQGSQESPEWGNGAFTKAVVEGLNGRADFQHTGRVTLNMLDLYISERVKELTKGSQSPTTAKPNTIQDFPIAVVR